MIWTGISSDRLIDCAGNVGPVRSNIYCLADDTFVASDNKSPATWAESDTALLMPTIKWLIEATTTLAMNERMDDLAKFANFKALRITHTLTASRSVLIDDIDENSWEKWTLRVPSTAVALPRCMGNEGGNGCSLMIRQSISNSITNHFKAQFTLWFHCQAFSFIPTCRYHLYVCMQMHANKWTQHRMQEKFHKATLIRARRAKWHNDRR